MPGDDKIFFSQRCMPLAGKKLIAKGEIPIPIELGLNEAVFRLCSRRCAINPVGNKDCDRFF